MVAACLRLHQLLADGFLYILLVVQSVVTVQILHVAEPETTAVRLALLLCVSLYL